ncbi:hypothetical protein [Leucobacter chromiiresistens]|uniref:Phospholipase_D-nuclease N-terminal n=1 Tax=Leucobacter chromiiresistens TaxID=1079994 RepID=A0A1H0ZVQ8_9MICO|nr:hypothetical protein [Leucobacter chromiiresistens]SDQ31508.1 hypothetical protein SAMN04488565_2104 [Leucobacter chromiiresistens]
MHDPAAIALAVLPGLLALAHAVLGLCAILSLAKVGPQLSWPKMIAWIFFIAAVPLVGSTVWFAAGRRRFARAAGDARPGAAQPHSAGTQ